MEVVVTLASYSSRLLTISVARGGNGRARLTSAKAGHRLEILDNNNNGGGVGGGGALTLSPFPSFGAEPGYYPPLQWEGGKEEDGRGSGVWGKKERGERG